MSTIAAGAGLLGIQHDADAFFKGFTRKARAIRITGYQKRLAQAEIAYSEGRYEDAIREADLGLSLAPSPDIEHKFRWLLAHSYHKTGRPEEAEFQSALMAAANHR